MTSESIIMDGPVAYMAGGKSAVSFTGVSATAGSFISDRGTAVPVREMQTALKVAVWGEDNRFPQNIEHQMGHCAVGKSALNWKTTALYGNGILPGKIVGYENGGAKEIFEPLDRNKYKPVYGFLNSPRMPRFYLEYFQDWNWFSNCFPEIILSKDGKSITGMVHQESCDARYKQMNDKAEIDTVYMSKLWGAAKNQYVQFDPKKAIRGLIENPLQIMEVDNKLVKSMDCIDMYDPVESLKEISMRQVESRGDDALKSAILPVNYPSVNKTYYQASPWDGARLGGWVELSCKIPALLRVLFDKALKLKWHIEVPYAYFHAVYGYEKWESMSADEHKAAKKKLLKEMNEYLSGDENAYKTFISFFDTDPVTKKEYGLIKITLLDDKSNIDKELISSSAADLQILIAMQVRPALFGAGTIGTGQQRSGGSDIRESWLTYIASLNLERAVAIGEPLSLVRDYNREVGGIAEWEEDIVFRVQDTILTTLDTGAGTKKVVS